MEECKTFKTLKTFPESLTVSHHFLEKMSGGFIYGGVKIKNEAADEELMRSEQYIARAEVRGIHVLGEGIVRERNFVMEHETMMEMTMKKKKSNATIEFDYRIDQEMIFRNLKLSM